MDYFNLIKEAFRITFKHKYLWILGILSAFTESSISVPNIGSFNSSDLEQIKNFFKSTNPASPSSTPTSNLVQNMVLGNKISINDFINWIQNHLNLIIIIGIILILLAIIVLVVSLMAKAGLIWGVSEIDSLTNNDRKVCLKDCFQKGINVFWRIFGFEIIIGLIVLATLLIYITPLIFMTIVKMYTEAIIWAIILLIPLIIVFLFLGILRQYSHRFIAIEKNGVSESLHNAYNLFRKNLKEVLIIWLLNIALSIVLAIILTLVIIIVALVLTFGCIALYWSLGATASIIFGIISALILLIILFLTSGIITTFISSYWTLAYLRLEK